MSPKIEIKNGYELEVESDLPIDIAGERWLGFVRDLNEAHRGLNCRKFGLEALGGDVYSYEYVAHDDRAWDQTIRIPADGTEATMTFAVADYWKESEFSNQRSVRLSCIALVRNYGVTKIKAEFPA